MIDIVRDLRPLFGPARDQGARPTCLAFAASDTHAGLRDGWAPLSCEFAFYAAQKRAGRPPTSGALLSTMLDALRLDGQPDEKGWPYLAAVPADHRLTMLSRSFFQPRGDGVVDPANDELPEPAQRHAVVAVGHGTVDGTPAILIRNSWGPGWGLEGHAWLTERFLAPRLFATANLTEEVDVSSHTAAA